MIEAKRGKKPERKIIRGEAHHRWKGDKFCVVCGSPQITAAERKLKTCNDPACRKASKALNRSGSKNGRYIDIQVFCKQCNEEITHNHRGKATYCSRECMGKGYSKNFSGKNSPHYKGVISFEGYPSAWTVKLRREIRKRDKQTCQICGIVKIGLDVHHIDRNKDNCNPDNLTTVCRSCHRRFEKTPEIFMQKE